MDFKLIRQIVKNIQDTIFNTGAGIVTSLRAHTFKAKVANFPKVQKVNGIVTVSNQKRVEKELKKSTIVQKSVLNWLKSFKLPTTMEVSNFPKPRDPLPYPASFEISNFPKPKESSKNIRVTNQPTAQLKALNVKIDKLTGEVKKLKLDPTINVESPKSEKIIIPAPSVRVTQEKIDYKKIAKLIPKASKGIDYEKLGNIISKKVAEMAVTVGGGGGTRKEGQDDLTREYNVSDKDAENLIRYYGFIGRSGQWYILKENTTTQEYRYVKGSDNYETNWTGRTALTYGIYNEVF